jgi:hypothetical protein
LVESLVARYVQPLKATLKLQRVDVHVCRWSAFAVAARNSSTLMPLPFQAILQALDYR